MYRLLFKIILVYGRTMTSKSQLHNLVHGPRPLKDNMKIFEELIDFMTIQLGHIYAIVVHKLDVKMQDTITRLLHRLIKFLDTVIWVNDSSSIYTKNGLPIKYNWL